jgi:Ca-activated chloride channel family protein
VFCIGVGNEVNKPLLQQMAQDSGGLASFISQGDNFSRQAKAFRRKLMRPAASDLKIDFGGLQITDVEPKALPNLYHGAPLRIYGRYHSGGDAQVTLRGSVNGVELKQAAQLQFPKEDSQNPEIDRMWALHKIDALLKDADRTSTRDSVKDEVVRLGEGYSIVTEYTSFLVLENDGEYQRWKIARNNALRNERERKAQDLVANRFEAIRSKAMASLGPLDASAVPASALTPARAPQSRSVPQAQPQPQTQSTPEVRSGSGGQSFNFGGGGGGSSPVGPLFVGLLVWLRRFKNGQRGE